MIRHTTKVLFATLLLAFCGIADAQLYTKFGPVNGVLKGNVGSPQTTAATSTDVLGLWSGCTAAKFLQGDGTCAQVNLATEVTGILPVANGGTGLATLPVHGVLLGEAAGNVGNVAAMAVDTLLQGKGASADPAALSVNNCGSATTALSYSTTTHTFGCQTITSGGTGTVVSVAAGTGITASPSPIISSGTVSLDLTASNIFTGVPTYEGGGGTATTLSVGTTSHQGILCVGNSTCGVNNTPGDPSHALEVISNGGTLQGVRLMTYASGAAFITPLHWARANGTQASPTAILSQDNIMSMGARGWDGSEISQSALAIEGIATENWTTSANGAKIQFEAVTTGTVSRKPVFAIIAANGANNPTMITNGTGGTSVAYMPVVDAAGTRYGYWGKASGSNNDISFESDAGLRLVANNGANPLTVGVSGSPLVAFNGVGMAPLEGTYIATYTGFTTTISVTASWYKIGDVFCTSIPGALGTSNATTFTITGLPSAAQITTAQAGGSVPIENNTIPASGGWNLGTGSLVILVLNTPSFSDVWTASGTKGIPSLASLSACWPTN